MIRKYIDDIDIINDVSMARFDAEILNLAAEYSKPYVL